MNLEIPASDKIVRSVLVCCVASTVGEYERVSIMLRGGARGRLPDLEECQAIKDVFWDDEDTVVMGFPDSQSMKRMDPYSVHLWRKKGENPPALPWAEVCV